MTLGILVNKDKDTDYSVTKRIIRWCSDNEISLYFLEDENINIENIEILKLDVFFKKIDIVIVVGGDGTVLRWIDRIAESNKEVLGINCGTVGYLTVVEKNKIEEVLTLIKDNNIRTSNHRLLESTIEGKSYLSLNEISIKSTKCKVINIKVYVDNEYVHTFRGDGIIICTPSGSTAYNLSSGGPLIMNNAKVICITPICPHQLFAKPIVINDNSKINLICENRNKDNIEISNDGKHIDIVKDEFNIQIKKSNKILNAINPFNKNFYEILLNKLIGISE